jgi:hypothetical protein
MTFVINVELVHVGVELKVLFQRAVKLLYFPNIEPVIKFIQNYCHFENKNMSEEAWKTTEHRKSLQRTR